MAFKITNKGLYWWLIGTFTLLYGLVAFVSTLHAIDFFRLSNIGSLAILLGIAYEVGQASVLFSILMTKNKEKFLPWVLMILLTALQVTANVYASFKHMSISGSDDWQYWYTSILKIFGVMGGTTETYQVIISWISGALLPIIALGMTALVAQNIKLITEGEDEDENPEPIPAKDVISEVSRARLTDEQLAEAEMILSKKKPEGYHDLEFDVDKKEKVKEEVKKIKKIMKSEPIDSGAISDKIKEEIAPGLDHDDDDQFGSVDLTNEEPVLIEPGTLIPETSDPIKVTTQVPDDSEQLSQAERLSKILKGEKEFTSEPLPANPEAVLQTEIEFPEDPQLEEEVAELLDLQDKIEEETPTLKTNNGLIELETKEETPPEVSPQPEKVEDDEEERLEHLRKVARENLKKK